LFEEITADRQVPESPEHLQRLAAGVAHDLNNHLTVIHAYVDLLALDGHAGEHQALAAIRQAARDIGTLAGQLLAFGHPPPDQPAVSLDLNRLIDDTRDLLQLLAGKGTAIELRLAPDLRPVPASPGQMARVLVALSTHAPSTNSGGRTLTFETANTSSGVALSVTDTGLELDEQAGAHLFEPFACPLPGGSTGLGLATAHAIVTRHGGQIAVTRAPHRGTTFTLYLPAQKGIVPCPG
jgi:two-component system cell cycle sensor histidine kinase/response regulator CckA